MLGNSPFFYRTIRKSVLAFSTVFKDIILIKYTNDSSMIETARLTVPITYADKENFINRLYGSSNGPPKPIQVNLPAMSFELDPNFKYQPDRKLSSFNSMVSSSTNNGQVNQQSQGVPYDLTFYLYIYVRNIEDGNQIIEQILPFFSPDYTVTIDYLAEMGITRNVPLILDSVNQSIEHEGDETQVRTIVWTLAFTMPINFYGPILNSGVIKTANVNLRYGLLGGVLTSTGLVELFMSNSGLGNYQVGESVYQGSNNLPDANVIGSVVSWDQLNHILVLGNTQGAFTEAGNAFGATSGASWRIVETTNNMILATDTAAVSPNTANINSDYLILNSWLEFPNTL